MIDKETMFLPSLLLWAVWLGLGLHWLFDRAESAESAGATGRWWATASLRAVLAGSVAFAIAFNFQLVDLSSDRSARERGEAILAAAPEGALVVGWWQTIPVLQYLQLVEGRRADLQLVNRFLLDDEARDGLPRILWRESRGRAVLVDDPMGLTGPGVELRPAGPLWRLVPSPSLDGDV